MPRIVRTTAFTTRELRRGPADPHEGKENLATFQVTFVTDGQEQTVPVADDAYLLDAATDAGLELPFRCLQGWCTTCAGKALEGKVDQTEARRIFPQDEAAGFVLLCSAYPRSDLRILTHQKEVMRAFRRSHGLPAPRG